MLHNNDHKPNLESDFLILAYCNGYFPMASGRNGAIEWYSPDLRAIIPLDQFRTSRSLRQTIRKGKFEIRIDTAFEKVMRACAERPETWISEEIIQSYVGLYQNGYGHSVETWHEDVLVGGLYGVAIRGAFFGESMFSRMTDASKIALAYLVGRLRERKFVLLDTQFMTDHLRKFGTVEVPREKYLQLLATALDFDVAFLD